MGGEAQLWISMQLAEQIRRHGAETYPYECCGALLGRDNPVSAHGNSEGDAEKPQREVLALFPLVNRRDDSPRNRFSVTSGDVRAAEKEAARQGIDVVGWYHSHPDHPARPRDRKSTRLNSSHSSISYAVFCLKKKKKNNTKFDYTKKKKIKDTT